MKNIWSVKTELFVTLQCYRHEIKFMLFLVFVFPLNTMSYFGCGPWIGYRFSFASSSNLEPRHHPINEEIFLFQQHSLIFLSKNNHEWFNVVHAWQNNVLSEWYRRGIYKFLYKITRIVRTLWLAERRGCMRVCNHGCDVTLSVSPAHFKAVSLTLKYKY